jgi:polyferredoxin
MVISTLIISMIFGKRASCHYDCLYSPFMIIGRKIRNLFNIPALQLKSDKDKCVNCNLCSKECPMSLDVTEMVTSGKMENTECIMCGACIDVCKSKVIKFSFGRKEK